MVLSQNAPTLQPLRRFGRHSAFQMSTNYPASPTWAMVALAPSSLVDYSLSRRPRMVVTVPLQKERRHAQLVHSALIPTIVGVRLKPHLLVRDIAELLAVQKSADIVDEDLQMPFCNLCTAARYVRCENSILHLPQGMFYG